MIDSLPSPSPLGRRTFLRAAGTSLALPFLPSFSRQAFAAETTPPAPKRMIAISLG